MSIKIDLKILKELSKPNLGSAMLLVITEYIVIILLAVAAIYIGNTLITLLAMWLIAARIHALLGLGHDATHFMFCKHKKINDIIANIFIFFPGFASLSVYRQRHFSHHQNLNTDDDPDFVSKKSDPNFKFPQKKIIFLKNVTSYLFGVHHLFNIFDKKKNFKQKIKYILSGLSITRNIITTPYKQKRREQLLQLLYTFLVVSYFLYMGWIQYYFIYWICPLFLIVPFLIRVRAILEHYGDIKSNIEASRTVYPTLWDSIFLGYELNVTYHLDHHLFPSVPSWNAKKLHKELLKNKKYIDNAHITKNGIYGVFCECTV